jgi:hypothetical protein
MSAKALEKGVNTSESLEILRIKKTGQFEVSVLD